MSEFYNVRLHRNKKEYRVCFRGERVMCVVRKTPTGSETPLQLDGPLAKSLIEQAWEKRSANIG